MRAVAIVFFLSTLIAPLLAAELPIYIEGNIRTKETYIRHLIATCQQDDEISLDQCLLNSKLFSSVEVISKSDRTIVKIRDRWTLIPIPRFESSSEGATYGLFLLEQNFLGEGKFAMAGATFGPNAKNYLLLYKDKDLFYSDWIAHLIVNIAAVDYKAYEQKEFTRSFNETQQVYRVGIGHKLSHSFETNVYSTYVDYQYRDIDDQNSPANNRVFGIDGDLRYDRTNFKFYFNQGIESRLTLVTDLNRSDREKLVKRGYFNFNYQDSFFDRQALQIAFNASLTTYASDKSIDKLGGGQGFRGIQSNGLWTRRIANVAVDYQIPVNETSYGTWTVAPFFDYGIYSSQFNSSDNFMAYGLGGYLYLKEVAMPGVGFIAGRNPHFLGSFSSISVGFRM